VTILFPKNGKTRKVEMSDRLRTVLRELYRERFERVVQSTQRPKQRSQTTALSAPTRR